jgi:hypothetical protein
MAQPQQRPRTAEEWKALGRAMAQEKEQHRREMGPSFEIVPIVPIPIGCGLMLLAWPLMAVLCLLGLSMTGAPGANPPSDGG